MASFLRRPYRLDRHQKARRSLSPLLRLIPGEWSIPGAPYGTPVMPTAPRTSRHTSFSSGMNSASVTIAPNTAAYRYHLSYCILTPDSESSRLDATGRFIASTRLVAGLLFPSSVPSPGASIGAERWTLTFNVYVPGQSKYLWSSFTAQRESRRPDAAESF